MRRTITVLTIALLAGATSLAQDGVRIGVMDLVSETVSEAETRILSNRLRIELVRTGEFTVIERERMDLILEEQGFQMSGCVAVECIVEIGQLLGMEKMIAGNIDKLGDIYMTNLRMVDVETGAIERVAQQDCQCGLQDVATNSLAQLAAEIAGLGQLKSPPPPAVRAQAPSTVDPQGTASVSKTQAEATVWPTPTTWTSGPAMPTARMSHASGVIDGKLYVVGGVFYDALEVYDPALQRWMRGPAMPTARGILSASVIDGKLYVVGGIEASELTGPTFSDVLEIYDPTANVWMTGPAMPAARAGHATGVIDGKLYVVGGLTGSMSRSWNSNALEIYDPIANRWISGPAMATARNSAAAGVIDGKLYVVGGSTGSEYTNALEVYDAVASRWTVGPAMPTGRNGPVAGSIGGIFYVVGGSTASGLVSSVLEVYDPALQLWTRGPAMPTARGGSSASVIDGKLYVVGGTTGSESDVLEILGWAAPDGVIMYTVRHGDTLWQIAQAYGTTVVSIRQLNDLGRGERIHVGQRLVVRRD